MKTQPKLAGFTVLQDIFDLNTMWRKFYKLYNIYVYGITQSMICSLNKCLYEQVLPNKTKFIKSPKVKPNQNLLKVALKFSKYSELIPQML